MKKILVASVLAAVLGASFAAGAAAQTATPTPTPAPVTAPPVQGAALPVVLYVDTVQGAGGKPAPAAGCSQSNLFRRGQVVVFRVWGINTKANGVALTDKNVMTAYVTIPGLSAPLTLTYGAHGTAPNQVAFWSAPWFTKDDTSLGVVDFTVTVITKNVTIKDKSAKNGKRKIGPMTATYSQKGFATPSRLTITP